MSACKIVTIKKKTPLFKGEEKANSIELIELEEINNLWENIKFPITLIGTQKIDGSSITLYSKLNASGERVSGICSRNLEKPLTCKKEVGKKEYKGFSKFFMWCKKHLVGLTEEDIFIFEDVENDSEFVKIGKPYLDALIKFTQENNLSIALRGELNGKGLKGSGNKNNPSVKEEPNIKFYAVDDYSSGVTNRQSEETFDSIIKELGFTRCKKYFTRKMRCKSDVIKLCEKIIAKEKENGNIIEGIVLKTPDGQFSCKYMNLEYDSKK